MEAILVRHGESTANARGIWQGRLDFPLSRQGWRQAAQLGRALRSRPVAAIYSSPQLRAVQTARAVAGELGRPPGAVVLLDGLAERHGGILQGTAWAELEARDPELVRRFWSLPDGERWQLLGAESTPAVVERSRQALEEIRGRHGPDEAAVVVSHGGLLETLLMDLLGAEALGGRRLPNASVTRLLLADPAPRLLELGSTAHLEGGGEAPPGPAGW